MPSELSIRMTHEITLVCTPEDLRELADEVERKIKDCKVGDDTLVRYIYGKRVTVAIRVDQERI
jgi:hypothetical protein